MTHGAATARAFTTTDISGGVRTLIGVVRVFTDA